MKVAGVAISSPDREVWPGITKLALARYVERVGARMVAHVAGRPLTLVRCPEGALGPCHFMRHGRSWGPAPLRTVKIREKHKTGEYLVADDAAGLVALVQMGVVEVHTWNSRADDVERPDRVVLDLDPGPEVAWPAVVDGARLIRKALAALGLESWVKTTGGKGLHVVAPLRPEHAWDVCLAFARGIAEAVAASDPRRYTTALPKQGREAKILIDYLRNNRTNTSVAAFSPRARPGATVSMPLAWRELSARLDPARFDVTSAPRRTARGADPWAAYFASRQRLSAAAIRAVARH